MERQLASLTGLVHKALTTSRPPPIQRDIEINLSREFLHVPASRDAVAVYKGGGGEYKNFINFRLKELFKKGEMLNPWCTIDIRLINSTQTLIQTVTGPMHRIAPLPSPSLLS